MKFFLIILIPYFNLVYSASEVKELNLSFDDFTVIQEKELEKTEPLEAPEVKTKNDTKSSSITDSVKSLFNIGLNKAQTLKESLLSNKELKPKKRIKKKDNSPEANFPEPLFYDAIYAKKYQFFTYSYVYNNKSNRDNSYIPQVRDFDFLKELFRMAKTRNERTEFYTLYNASKGKKDFNINYQDKQGNTMLLTSLYNGNFEIFFFLVIQGADVNICNYNNICPIQLGVYSNNESVVEFLCNHEVDIMKRDKEGISVFEYALYERNYKISTLILERYLDYPIKQTERRDLIQFAKSTGMEDFAIEMEEIFKLHAKNSL